MDESVENQGQVYKSLGESEYDLIDSKKTKTTSFTSENGQLPIYYYK